MKRGGCVRAPSLASFTINSADFFTPLQMGSQNFLDSFALGSTQLVNTWISSLQQALNFLTLFTDNFMQTFSQSMTGLSNSLASGQTTGYGAGGYYF